MKRLFFILLCLWGMSVSAQDWSLKTNLIYDVSTTVNVGFETKLSPKWTLDVSANWNPWEFSENKKWKQLSLQPEARYWFCEAFNGHFVGAHLLGGIYNMGNWDTDFKFLGTDFGKLQDYRYEGWMLGVGVAYGYQWLLSKHWSVEAEIGIGYVFSQADKYECATCGDKLENNEPHHYFGPTKAAINLIYVF